MLKDHNPVQSVIHDLNNSSIYLSYHFLLLAVPPDSERWSKSFQAIGFVENWPGCCCWQADWSSSKYCCIRWKQMLQKRQIQSKQGVRLWFWIIFHILNKGSGNGIICTTLRQIEDFVLQVLRQPLHCSLVLLVLLRLLSDYQLELNNAVSTDTKWCTLTL